VEYRHFPALPIDQIISVTGAGRTLSNGIRGQFGWRSNLWIVGRKYTD